MHQYMQSIKANLRCCGLSNIPGSFCMQSVKCQHATTGSTSHNSGSHQQQVLPFDRAPALSHFRCANGCNCYPAMSAEVTSAVITRLEPQVGSQYLYQRVRTRDQGLTDVAEGMARNRSLEAISGIRERLRACVQGS